jgi:hypothetical protein
MTCVCVYFRCNSHVQRAAADLGSWKGCSGACKCWVPCYKVYVKHPLR